MDFGTYMIPEVRGKAIIWSLQNNITSVQFTVHVIRISNNHNHTEI